MNYDCAKLKSFVKAVMKTTGMSDEDAGIFADSLVSANMRGVASHGVTLSDVVANELRSVGEECGVKFPF